MLMFERVVYQLIYCVHIHKDKHYNIRSLTPTSQRTYVCAAQWGSKLHWHDAYTARDDRIKVRIPVIKIEGNRMRSACNRNSLSRCIHLWYSHILPEAQTKDLYSCEPSPFHSACMFVFVCGIAVVTIQRANGLSSQFIHAIRFCELFLSVFFRQRIVFSHFPNDASVI